MSKERARILIPTERVAIPTFLACGVIVDHIGSPNLNTLVCTKVPFHIQMMSSSELEDEMTEIPNLKHRENIEWKKK